MFWGTLSANISVILEPFTGGSFLFWSGELTPPPTPIWILESAERTPPFFVPPPSISNSIESLWNSIPVISTTLPAVITPPLSASSFWSLSLSMRPFSDSSTPRLPSGMGIRAAPSVAIIEPRMEYRASWATWAWLEIARLSNTTGRNLSPKRMPPFYHHPKIGANVPDGFDQWNRGLARCFRVRWRKSKCFRRIVSRSVQQQARLASADFTKRVNALSCPYFLFGGGRAFACQASVQ